MKEEVKNGIIIAVVVIIILVIVYFTTAVFMTGEIGGTSSDSEKTTTSAATNTEDYDNKIVAGRVFNQKEDNYMVVLFSKEKASEDLTSAINSYDSSSKDVKLYMVLLDEAVNKYVVSTEDNTNPSSSTDLKVKESALLVISSGKVTSYITDEEQIINALK